MRSVLLLALLLCTVYVAHVQAQDNKNTLRLCGRALMRAVVYTCGGSRWRRVTGGEETLQDGIGLCLFAGRREPELKRTDNDRQWRDLNQALITVCCQVGCRKSDLSMLC
ncbi:relaxin-3-like [Notothenia coriiceps]|uniref:Relaxin-3-like n=1 Tax=Notothenia coriiceps TaxID=8208 RepID=A0A6I9PA65_9TELE|nr:PREDICTED: relaxin-3-like [Notothenia coriiceps]